MSLEAILGRWLPTFLLALARCGGLVAFAPPFSGQAVPRQVKVGLSVLLALILTPLLPPIGAAAFGSTLGLAATLVGELAVGAVMGTAVRFTFAGIGMAGELSSIQIGLGMPAALDPHAQIQVTAVNNLLDQIAVLIFLAVGGHHHLLLGLVQSITLAPPLTVGFDGGTLEYLMGLFAAAFLLAVRLAAPVGAAMLVAMVALGLLNRAAPQVNVFMVSFALILCIGFLVLLVALPLLVSIIAASFRDLPGVLAGLLARVHHGL
jgi:flagellar biosynthesis protein FliR